VERRWALHFSPDSRLVTFTDIGTAPDGSEAIEVMTMELSTGLRRQISQLPRLTPLTFRQTVHAPSFIDLNQVLFVVESVEDGQTFVIVRADGSGEISRQKAPTVVGGIFIPDFAISRPGFAAVVVPLGMPAVNPLPGSASSNVSEIFVVGSSDPGGSRLQITDFRRSDTGFGGAMVSPDGSRVLFTSTADRFGTNPEGNCQFFSVDVLGADLRQVTTYSNGERNSGACGFPGETGCGVYYSNHAGDTVVFSSTCDPITGSSNGNDVFAMRFDGSGLVQLTRTHGSTIEEDGTVDVELPGPFGYPEDFPGQDP